MHDHFSKQLGDANDLNEDDLGSVAGGTVTAVAAGVGVSAASLVAGTTASGGW